MGQRIVFANEDLCNHVKAFEELGFISWTMKRVRFEVGDIIYVFLSKENGVKSDQRSIRYKAVVEKCDLDREDGKYWGIQAPRDKTYRLRLLEYYDGDKLTEAHLREHGFKGGRSLQRPMKNNPQLFAYINSVF